MISWYKPFREYFNSFGITAYYRGNVPADAAGVYAVLDGTFPADDEYCTATACIYSADDRTIAPAFDAAERLQRGALAFDGMLWVVDPVSTRPIDNGMKVTLAAMGFHDLNVYRGDNV